MPDMAGLEDLVVDPAHELQHMTKDRVQRLGLENCAVTQLMHSVDQEGPNDTMQENQRSGYPPVPVSSGTENRSTRDGQNAQETEGLPSALQIILGVQRLDFRRGQRGTIPSDRSVAPYVFGVLR